MVAVTNTLYFQEDGNVAYAGEINSDKSFILNNMLNYALDGATTTNQNNMKVDLFNSDTAQYLEFMSYNAGTDLYECVDTSGGDAFFVDIYADSVTTGSLTDNNCVAVQIGKNADGNIYRIYSTSVGLEVQRAEVMKTLFYGTSGSDPGIVDHCTNVNKICSSDSRDVGKKAYYATISFPSNAYTSFTADYTGTITSGGLTNSAWSYCTASQSGGGSTTRATVNFEFPSSTVVNTATARASSQTSDETGTDRSADEQDNPATIKLYVEETDYNGGEASGSIRAILLSEGSVSWVETDASNKASVSDTDFFTDNSIPAFTAVAMTTPLTCRLTTASTTITTSETLAIVKAVYTLTVGNTIAYEVSFDDGSNWESVTESVLSKITNTGTSFRVRMTITRATNTETDSITSYAAYYS